MTEFAAYFDDSGHPNSELVVAAGFVSTKEQWLKAEIEWQDAMEQCGLPRDTIFHMTDVMTGKQGSPFEGWTRAQKHRLLNKLAHILSIRTRRQFSDTVFMSDYRQINAKYAFEECVGAPFAVVARNALFKLYQWLDGQNNSKLIVFFEDGSKHKGDFMEACQRDRLPTPQFGAKNQLMPLQAADFLAWEISANTRRVIDHPQSPLFFKDYYFDVITWYNLRQFDHGTFRLSHLQELCDGIDGHPPVPLRSQAGPNAKFVNYSLPKRLRRRTVF